MHILTDVMGLQLIDDVGIRVTINWTAHDNADCIPLLTYYVAIFEDGSGLLESSQATNNQYRFNNLTYSTTYTIVVLAAIGNANGTDATINVTTKVALGLSLLILSLASTISSKNK